MTQTGMLELVIGSHVKSLSSNREGCVAAASFEGTMLHLFVVTDEGHTFSTVFDNVEFTNDFDLRRFRCFNAGK